MEYESFSAKTVEAALNEAAAKWNTTVEELDVEIVEEGSSGFFGIGSKPAVIKARKKFTLEGAAEEFLYDVFRTMNLEIELETVYNEDEKTMDIDMKGDSMGILIGKRGQTLDSLQYLTSLVVNKYSEDYIRIKLDIENYRERRKETLETLARNIAQKVKRTRRPVSLEPMNPYERRIIHSALQNDKMVTTRSEGEEPYRYVIISLKREKKEYTKEKEYNSRSGGYRRDYGNNNNRSGRNRRNSSRQDRMDRSERTDEVSRTSVRRDYSSGSSYRRDFGRRDPYTPRFESPRQEDTTE